MIRLKIFSVINYHRGRVLAGIILLILVAPIYSNPIDPLMTLTEDNSDSVVLVKRGQVIEVVLAMNPTTGYQWKAVSFNKKILKQDTTRFIPQGNAYGAGGMVVFRFEALLEGETNLKIGYSRPFDKDKKFERLFQVVIKVST